MKPMTDFQRPLVSLLADTLDDATDEQLADLVLRAMDDGAGDDPYDDPLFDDDEFGDEFDPMFDN